MSVPGPALYGDHTILGIDADYDAAGKLSAGISDQLGISLGRGTQNNPVYP
jgi:hypothetical protein